VKAQCWAYNDGGSICGKPATAVDPVVAVRSAKSI